jgi:hypothetical protein
VEALTTQSDEWLPALDGDARALGLMKRHYSWRDYRDRRPHRLFVGPGEKMVLLSRDCRALFVWRRFIDKSGQQGVNCAVFRNEGEALSSQLIRQAVALAWHRWPALRKRTSLKRRK